MMRVYHGTDTHAAGTGILRDGFLAVPRQPGRKPTALTPMAERVYVTSQLSYAMIYAIGGDISGSTTRLHNWDQEPVGYLFAIDLPASAAQLALPDEDLVGKLVYQQSFRWLNRLAADVLHPSRLQKVQRGDYESWAFAGKKILSQLSSGRDVDREKIQQLLEACPHWSLPQACVPRPAQLALVEKAVVTPKLRRDYSNLGEHLQFCPLCATPSRRSISSR